MQLELSIGGDLVRIHSPVKGDTEITFDIHLYHGARIYKTPRVFNVINHYIKTMSYQDQLALFNLYVRAKDVMVSSRTELALDTQLRDIFRVMVDIIDIAKLEYFVDVRSGIKVPSGGMIKNSYDEVDPSYRKEKTYIRSEYIQLITLSILYRIFIPIWDEYSAMIKPTVSAEGIENRAFQLIGETQILHYPAYAKLYEYIASSMQDQVNTAASTLSGIGRDGIPAWLLAMVSVRKLPLVDLDMVSQSDGEVVKALFSFVNSKLKRLPKNFMPDARERKPPTNNDDDQDASYFDTYRSKQVLNYGQIMTYKIYLHGQSTDQMIRFPDGSTVLASSDPNAYHQVKHGIIRGEIFPAPLPAEDQFNALLDVCHDLDESVAPEILSQVLNVCEGLEQEQISEHNRLLTQWMFSELIPVVAIDVMTRDTLVKAMVVTQTVLHHWGLHHLALASTGIQLPFGGTLKSGDVLAPLEDEHVAFLEQEYPHAKAGTGKAQSKSNYGFLSVQAMARLLTHRRLAVRTPPFLTTKDVRVNAQGVMSTPSTITHDLVEFLKRISEL